MIADVCACCHVDLDPANVSPNDEDYCLDCDHHVSLMDARIKHLESLVVHEPVDSTNAFGGFDCACGMPWVFGGCLTGIKKVEIKEKIRRSWWARLWSK